MLKQSLYLCSMLGISFISGKAANAQSLPGFHVTDKFAGILPDDSPEMKEAKRLVAHHLSFTRPSGGSVVISSSQTGLSTLNNFFSLLNTDGAPEPAGAYFQNIPLGTCEEVTTTPSALDDSWLDVGSKITVSSENTSRELLRQRTATSTTYAIPSAQQTQAIDYDTRYDVEFAEDGWADKSLWNRALRMPRKLSVTPSLSIFTPITISTTSPNTFTWTPTGSDIMLIQVLTNTLLEVCNIPPNAGTFTLPAATVARMPSSGTISFADIALKTRRMHGREVRLQGQNLIPGRFNKL